MSTFLEQNLTSMTDANEQNRGAQFSFSARESLAQMAGRYLEKEIIEGRLLPGTRLNPDELARSLNISKSPVREAILLLQRDGLVMGKPRSGFFVSEIRISDIEEIYPIRGALNALAVKTILESDAAESVVEKLSGIVEHLRPKVEAGDTVGYFHLTVELYNSLIGSCPNQRLQNMWHQLSKQILRFRFLVMSQPGHIARSFRDHTELLGYMRQRNIEAAMRCAERIMGGSLAELRTCLSKGTS